MRCYYQSVFLLINCCLFPLSISKLLYHLWTTLTSPLCAIDCQSESCRKPLFERFGYQGLSIASLVSVGQAAASVKDQLTELSVLLQQLSEQRRQVLQPLGGFPIETQQKIETLLHVLQYGHKRNLQQAAHLQHSTTIHNFNLFLTGRFFEASTADWGYAHLLCHTLIKWGPWRTIKFFVAWWFVLLGKKTTVYITFANSMAWFL